MKIKFLTTFAVCILVIGCKVTPAGNGTKNPTSEVDDTISETIIDIADSTISNPISSYVYNLKDTFMIELPLSFTSGLIWKLKHISPSIDLIKKQDAQRVLEGRLQDFQQFYFVGKKKDSLELNFNMIRAFGKDSTVYDNKNYSIIIK